MYAKIDQQQHKIRRQIERQIPLFHPLFASQTRTQDKLAETNLILITKEYKISSIQLFPFNKMNNYDERIFLFVKQFF